MPEFVDTIARIARRSGWQAKPAAAPDVPLTRVLRESLPRDRENQPILRESQSGLLHPPRGRAVLGVRMARCMALVTTRWNRSASVHPAIRRSAVTYAGM